MNKLPFIKTIKVDDLEVRLFGNGDAQIKAPHGAVVNVDTIQLGTIIHELDRHFDAHFNAKKPDHLRLDLDDDE